MSSYDQYVEIENQLAEAMIEEVASNEIIKEALQEIGIQVRNKILNPIKQVVSRARSVGELPDNYKKTIEVLAFRHSEEGRQFGAIKLTIPHAENILASIDKVNELLDEFGFIIENIMTIQTAEEAARLIKTLNDLCGCYMEHLHDLHSTQFAKLESMIFPTPEEFDMRISWVELGMPPQYTRSFGIATQKNKDLIAHEDLINNQYYRISGKSIFATLSIKKRFEIMTKELDRHIFLYTRLKNTLTLLQKDPDKNNVTLSNQMDELRQQINAVENQLSILIAKFQYYKIPVDKKSREKIATYAKRYQTNFEKLAKRPLSSHAFLPLIAGPSGSTARFLITLQDIGAFWREGFFDINRAQIISNCIMGFFIMAGHHSYVEIGEIYNRLLDYVAIEHPEQCQSELSAMQVDQFADGKSQGVLAQKLPYYKMGDYPSFLHPSYKENLIHKLRFPLPRKGG